MTFDIEPLKKQVLARYPWFGGIMASTSFEETDAVRSIGNDGRTIYYRSSYLTALTIEERIFTLAHELCHIAFRHPARGKGKDPEVWKNACDAVINQMLKRDGLPIVRGGVDYPEAIDYDVETYYEILLREKLEIELVEGQMQRQDGPGGADGEGGPNGEKEPGQEKEESGDDHSLWDDADDAADQEEDEEGNSEETIFQDLDQIQELVELSPDGEGEREENEDEDQDPEELGLVSETVSQSGNSERRDLRTVSDIGNAGPIIDWRLLLRDTINYGVDWSFTHATLEDGIVRPALEERPMPETEIVLDTSWSVDEDLLRGFLRECKNIFRLSKLKAGCFDTVFYGFHDIRTEDDIENMPFEGGGGTDFDVATGAFTLRVDNRIIFTDGEAPMPQEPLNAIWMVYGGEKIDPPGGTVIHISDEQLEQLMKR